MAAIALANGLNANMLRKWVREQEVASGVGPSMAERGTASSAMVAVTVAPNIPAAEIRVDVRRGGTTIQMAWPVVAVASLGDLLARTARMIRPSEIWVVVEPVDIRGGIDGLSLRVQNLLGRTPCDGAAYAFRNRRGTRLKLLIWDGTGVWLCHRRLHRGHFTWPTADTSTRYYNSRRPHSALGYKPPVTRLGGNNLLQLNT